MSKGENSEDNQSDEIINMPSTSKGTNNYNYSPQMTTSTPYDQETITVSTFGDLLGNEGHNVNPFSTVSEINNSSGNSFNENLGIWVVECNIPNATVNKLLKLMKKQDNINTQDLPYDSRTL